MFQYLKFYILNYKRKNSSSVENDYPKNLVIWKYFFNMHELKIYCIYILNNVFYYCYCVKKLIIY